MQDRVGLLSIDNGVSKYFVRLDYTWYKVAEEHKNYVSPLIHFIQAIEEKKKSYIWRSEGFREFLWDPEKNEIRKADGSFIAREKMVQKVLDWFRHIRDTCPDGYILE